MIRLYKSQFVLVDEKFSGKGQFCGLLFCCGEVLSRAVILVCREGAGEGPDCVSFPHSISVLLSLQQSLLSPGPLFLLINDNEPSFSPGRMHHQAFNKCFKIFIGKLRSTEE